jgi:hypothetical protein
MAEAPVPQPTELVYEPRASWAPLFLALGLAIMINGIFAEGFLFRGWVYSIAGAVIALAAMRSLVAGAVRDFMRLPRRQRARSAVIPPVTLKPPGA